MSFTKKKRRTCNCFQVDGNPSNDLCAFCWYKEEEQHLMNKDENMIGRIKTLASEGQKYILSRTSVVHSLVVILGISAWIGINGIFVQLPLLVISAPEGWNLAAYLVVTIQAANVGPAIYTLAKKLLPGLDESLCIFGLLLVGSSSMGLLAFSYDKTYKISGAEHSVTLFICVFFAALVGCTSSVLFMPYLRNCSETYLASYFIGEGLSGVLPSVIAFFQGVGGNPKCVDYGNGTVIEVTSPPRFPPRDYFLFVFATLLLSLCTFGILQYHPSIRKNDSLSTVNERESTANNDSSIDPNVLIFDEENISLGSAIYLHVLVGLVCFFANGFLPGIQTYSCLPYGNVAYHLTVTLANIANPIACLLYLWLGPVSSKIFNGLTLIATITCAYAIYLAAMSPIPPLRDSPIIGVASAVLAWIFLTGTASYIKLAITSTVRSKVGPKALVVIGVVMQLGSACGALLSFVLINYATLFHQYNPCAPL